MSTPNFYNKNASKIFACEVSEDFDYDALIGNLQYDKRLGGNPTKNAWESDYDRSYPGRVVNQNVKQIGNWLVSINTIVRSAYYSGVNIDWEYIVENERKNYFSNNELFDDVPKGVRKYLDKEIKKMEKVFAEYSTPLICRAIFSNGEAIYERIKN